MDQARASGELEGTTTGSSSRDGDRGTRSQRRTHSSSGFLLDSSSLPRSASLRSSNHRPRHSDPDVLGKRGSAEADTLPPKKRSRFPWSRQKESPKESRLVSPDIATGLESQGFSRLLQETTVTEPSVGIADNQGAAGLDKDSLQIVNLALNLSESRRRGNVGYPVSNRISGGNWASSADGHNPAATVSYQSNTSHSGRTASQTFVNDRVKSLRSTGATVPANDILNLIPHSATSDPLPHGFSGGTLARAAKVRHHFDLFHEYLRLLPSLPPLKPQENHSTIDSLSGPKDQYPTHRTYNPLQAIRNRKIRFRERCPIDTEAGGWNDVEKIHHWVNLVETKYSRQTRSPFECLTLPPFQQRPPGVLSNETLGDVDASGISPPSSLRRVSRTGSVKSSRPRSDWVIYPDEFLADAAWTEEAQNKGKIVDRDGNPLYPDPSLLVVDVDNEHLKGKKSTDTAQLSSHASLSDTRRSLSIDLNDAGRGRRPHRFRTRKHMGYSSSASEKELDPKRRNKLRMRSGSSSSSSSAQDRPYHRSLVDYTKSLQRSVSPSRKAPIWNRFDEKRGSMSSVPSTDDRYDPLSLAMKESMVSNTAMDISYFPGIASNLSAHSSRSPSPPKRRLQKAIGPRRAQGGGSPHRKDAAEDSYPESESARKESTTAYFVPASQSDAESNTLASKVATSYQDGQTRPSFHDRKDSVPHESKLRGIFKGPGKIAGKVGNEVSKMGDFILKKDTLGHSRKSSFATSDGSEVDDEEIKSEKLAIPKAILRRFPTFSDDANRPSPRSSEKSFTKNHISSSSPVPVNSRQEHHDDERKTSNIAGAQRHLQELQEDDKRDQHGNDGRAALGLHHGKPGGLSSLIRGQKSLEFGPELHTVREQIKKGRIKDPSAPFSLTRPPITGLAQAQPTPASSPQNKRPPMPSQSRSWSISDRSISVSLQSGVPEKQEIERTRALLLSSGIKAREITRRAETVRNPPRDFLRRSFDAEEAIPPVPRLYEHDLASQKLLKRIEVSHNLLQSSIDRFPKTTFLPLKSQLSMLEGLVNDSLNPRVHAAAQEAENLSVQLNTTSTLAVKQLSETLDRGIRKRHRRLRWLRRTGFMMLEWALVGLLWWVWLIVVAFKLLRKLFGGMVSGVRWVLWL